MDRLIGQPIEQATRHLIATAEHTSQMLAITQIAEPSMHPILVNSVTPGDETILVAGHSIGPVLASIPAAFALRVAAFVEPEEFAAFEPDSGTEMVCLHSPESGDRADPVSVSGGGPITLDDLWERVIGSQPIHILILSESADLLAGVANILRSTRFLAVSDDGLNETTRRFINRSGFRGVSAVEFGGRQFGLFGNSQKLYQTRGDVLRYTNVATEAVARQSSYSRHSKVHEPNGMLVHPADGRFKFHTDEIGEPWVELEFPTLYAVSHLILYNRLLNQECSLRARRLIIEISLDGVEWRRVFDAKGRPFGGVDGYPLSLNLGDVALRRIALRIPEIVPMHLDRLEVYGRRAEPACREGTAPSAATPFLVAHRISGLGDMMSQAAHLIDLGSAIGSPVFIDWRRSLYSTKTTNMINLFGSIVFHDDALPVERSPELGDDPRGREIASGRYEQVISIPDYLRMFDGEAVISTAFAVATGPMSEQLDLETLYERVGKFYFGDSVCEIAKSFWRVNNLSGAIGLHYRHGNGEFEGAKSAEQVQQEIQQCLEPIASITARSKREPKIFLCTDSKESEALFRAHLGNRLIVFPKYFREKGAGALHVVSHDADDGAHLHKILEDALVEMLLLAQCDYLVRDSWSTFTNFSAARIFRRFNDMSRIVFLRQARAPMAQLTAYSRFTEVTRERRQ
jgi:hypothetical protein